MNAIILAAGFGTRLKPWTDHHPKGLVKVGGKPMLKRVIEKLILEGFENIVVNTHHFSNQIIDFINTEKFASLIRISDESERILDTGGGVLRAYIEKLNNNKPVLVHNVDILSNANLSELMKSHIDSGRDVTLITSDRNSSRKLIFDSHADLQGWIDIIKLKTKPADLKIADDWHYSAFSGIYILNPKAIDALAVYSQEKGTKVFPIMEFFISSINKIDIGEIKINNLNLIDIGKPETLAKANAQFIDGDVECAEVEDACDEHC